MSIKVPDTGLELREMSEADYGIYVDKVIEQGEVYLQYGEESTEEIIELIQIMNWAVVYYSIFDSLTNTLVGYVGITPETDNLEFHIFKEHRQKGYGAAAVECFAKAYLDGLITGEKKDEVIATTLSENAASINLLKKIGFTKNSVGLTFSTDESREISVRNFIRVYKLVA